MMQRTMSTSDMLALRGSIQNIHASNRACAVVDSPEIQSHGVKTFSEDFRLVQALREGKEEAFSQLIEEYHSTLMRLARAYVSSDAVAEEVVQETWMGVLEGVKRFEGRSSIKTWIFRILTNRAKTRGQQERRYIPFQEMTPDTVEKEHLHVPQEDIYSMTNVSSDWTLTTSRWEEKTPERLMLSKEILHEVEKAIQQLPRIQQLVIIFRDVEGLDAEEVCAMLDVTMTNQRVLLHRARMKVCKALMQSLGDPSLIAL